MSGPQYVGDPTSCGSSVEPNIVYVPVPCTYTYCYSMFPQKETVQHEPKTKTPYDELVDSFVQSNLKALGKTSMNYTKEDNVTPLRQETAVKQLKQEMNPVTELSNKSLNNKDPDCKLTNNEDTKSVKSPSWASNFLHKIGQPHPKGIKVNLKPQLKEKPTSSSLMKTPETKHIESSQKNNTIDIFVPIRPKLKFVIPKLNQPKKELNISVESELCKNNSINEMTKEKHTVKSYRAEFPKALPKKNTQEKNTVTTLSLSRTKSTNDLPKDIKKGKNIVTTFSPETSMKSTNALPKDITKHKNTITTVSPETSTKLTNALPKEISKQKNTITIVSSETSTNLTNLVKEITKVKKNTVTTKSGTIAKLPKTSLNKSLNRTIENLGPASISPSKNKSVMNVISSCISKINEKYLGLSLYSDRKIVDVKETHKTKEKNKPSSTKHDMTHKKKVSPTKSVSRAQSNHAISTSHKEIKYNKHYFNEKSTEKILMNQKLPKVKYIHRTKISGMHNKYSSVNENDIISTKKVLKNLGLKQETICGNLSHSFTKGADDIFDLRQKLDKKEICKKIQELENTQNEIKQYLQKNRYDNSLAETLNKNEKHIAAASLNTHTKPKETRVKEIKLVIKIIHEEQNNRSAVEPSIKNETNDDLDFLNDFNVDEVVNYLNECDDKSCHFNEKSPTNFCATDINDNIEEKLEMLFKESPQENLEHKEICDNIEVSKEIIFEQNIPKVKVSEVLINESRTLDPNENLLSCVKIQPELEFTDDNGLAKPKFLENMCNIIPMREIRNIEKNKILGTNSNGVGIRNDNILSSLNTGDNNELDLNNISYNEFGVGEEITETEPNDKKPITTDCQTESEYTNKTLPYIENGPDQEIKSNQSHKEATISIKEDAITNATQEPEVFIDHIPMKQKENALASAIINDNRSDKNNVLKPLDEIKNLKRKNHFQQDVTDTSSTVYKMQSNVSCSSNLSLRAIILAQTLHNSISEYFEKKLKATILSVIHTGQFSTIFQCKNSDDVNYAAKISNNWNHKVINNFMKQEAMIKAYQKDIPTENLNCVYLVKGFVVDQRWGLMMEYYPYNLQQFMDEKKSKCFNVKQLQNLARQLVGAVVTLRNCQIIHSDIKPTHILLNAAGNQLKLCGFDSAYYVKPPALLPNIGTINYRAPEIIIGHSAGFSIDVWSTAVVLYEIVTGYQLFPGIYNNDILFKQMSTLGNIPMNMLENSSFISSHFRGTIFLRRVGYMGQKTVLIQSFHKSEWLRSTIFKEYTNIWSPSYPKGQQDREISKLRSFVKLLEQMLTMHPKHRLPIEFVYASPFIHKPF